MIVNMRDSAWEFVNSHRDVAAAHLWTVADEVAECGGGCVHGWQMRGEGTAGRPPWRGWCRDAVTWKRWDRELMCQRRDSAGPEPIPKKKFLFPGDPGLYFG